MKETHLVTEGFEGYELLDSGEHRKLERFGEVVLARPDTQAIWKQRDPSLWEKADATFSWHEGKGAWKKREDFPTEWNVPYKDARYKATLGNFKHTGLFPEQAPNWQWSTERIASLSSPTVLNLFGYTGAASVIAAQAGAHVVHVDSSKSALTWCKENAERSRVAPDAITYIHEDARRYAKREAKRGARYDGIILDPPAFGRGAKDEVWKVEEDLLPLIETLQELLAPTPGSFLLLNGYAAGYAPRSFAELLRSVFTDIAIEYGELRLQESGTDRVLPEGMYARFVR